MRLGDPSFSFVITKIMVVVTPSQLSALQWQFVWSWTALAKRVVCSSWKFLQLLEFTWISLCQPGSWQLRETHPTRDQHLCFPPDGAACCSCSQASTMPWRKKGAMFQCFSKGAGREDESALGMRPQRSLACSGVVTLLTLVLAKLWLLQAPRGGLSFLVDLVTAESGWEFFWFNIFKFSHPVLPLPSQQAFQHGSD